MAAWAIRDTLFPAKTSAVRFECTLHVFISVFNPMVNLDALV